MAGHWDVDRLSDMVSAHAPDDTYRFVSAAVRELLGYERYEACVARIGGVLRAEAISPVFQPIVALDGERVVAYEALARFPGDPAHRPDRWFADAWSVGLGVPLELLAVRAALRALPLLPPDVLLCVNVSPETVATPGFLAALADDAHRVVAEITEQRQLDDEAFERKLAPLRAAGGSIAIDDFGAGHASLSQVLAVAPDWIKLDMSLTRRLDESSVARALSAALVSFADEVGIDIVAEGIENPGQLATLRELGIRYAQGYHFGRPATADALPRGAD
jgi:EAL domain-containing protein (putative c-di-GMP-specific phosphodiesterase class I)